MNHPLLYPGLLINGKTVHLLGTYYIYHATVYGTVVVQDTKTKLFTFVDLDLLVCDLHVKPASSFWFTSYEALANSCSGALVEHTEASFSVLILTVLNIGLMSAT